MTQTHQPAAAALQLLKASPRRIASASHDLSDSDLSWKPAPDSWSVAEVVAHLRACADVWGDSITKILSQDNPTLRHVSPRAWIRKTNYLDLAFTASFLAFRKQRESLLKTLELLPQEDWSRGASVKMAAGLREETVLSFVRRLANHEAGHCEQIDRILQAWSGSGM